MLITIRNLMIRATIHYEKYRGMVHEDMQLMILEELKKQ